MSIEKETILKIKTLREQGFSISEISCECHISKSTALRHIKNIQILPQYYKRWKDRNDTSKIISERNWEKARENAYNLVSDLEQKDLKIMGSMLYWAEGSKKDFSFLNTDAQMIKIFLYILRNGFKIKNEELVISLRIYEDLDKKKCLGYWSKITGVNLDNKTSVNILKGFKKGKLQYGMCRIRVRKGGWLLKEIFSITERINHIISPRSSMDRTVAS